MTIQHESPRVGGWDQPAPLKLIDPLVDSYQQRDSLTAYDALSYLGAPRTGRTTIDYYGDWS